jgi:alkylhydroperoxidase family enzyme
MHNRDARGRGEYQERLDLLPVWREAPCFSAREQAALGWTEAMTRLSSEGVPDRVYRDAKEHFSDAELVNLTTAVVAINGWNRVCVAFRIVPTVAAA